MLTSNIRPESHTEYPCLLQGSNGLVVLFTKARCGVIVVGGTGVYAKSVGVYRECWGMHYFSDFRGSVQLANNYENKNTQG